ncbi:MAG: mechanosensitive ion channel family protein [Treponema sp.]|nr:mechanosensitive ion channel family protein [Treponema sp.]
MGQKLLELWEFHSAAVLALAKNLLAAVIIIVIGIILSKGAQRIIKRAEDSGSQVQGTVGTLLRAVVRYGIFIICAIMILNVFGVNTASLLAVLGAAGVAVGLALKDTLGNIAAGIIILLMGTCRKGEFIEFGGYMGTVKEINLFTTILETPDGIYISAPNSCIWASPLRNYTRNGKRRMELSIGIDYADSIDLAFQAMQGIIDSEPRFLADPAPQVILQAIQDSSVQITIRAWTTADEYWTIFWEMNKILKTRIEAAGLHIPFPQRDVRLVQR